mmetsp:Transcript_30092/g.70160  ORF Transcript_30092/g.70160 Transcript_30092/m.70160 type:complete len:202 (+) Transcript_30092:329-934(+)
MEQWQKLVERGWPLQVIRISPQKHFPWKTISSSCSTSVLLCWPVAALAGEPQVVLPAYSLPWKVASLRVLPASGVALCDFGVETVHWTPKSRSAVSAGAERRARSKAVAAAPTPIAAGRRAHRFLVLTMKEVPTLIIKAAAVRLLPLARNLRLVFSIFDRGVPLKLHSTGSELSAAAKTNFALAAASAVGQSTLINSFARL